MTTTTNFNVTVTSYTDGNDHVTYADSDWNALVHPVDRFGYRSVALQFGGHVVCDICAYNADKALDAAIRMVEARSPRPLGLVEAHAARA